MVPAIHVPEEMPRRPLRSPSTQYITVKTAAPTKNIGWSNLLSRFGSPTLPAILLLASLAVATSASAGPFAATTLSPNSQTVSVGTPSSIDVIFSVGTAQFGQTYGMQAWLTFNPNILQITSLTNGLTSPFSNVGTSVFNNTLGTLSFQATGSSVSNVSFTAFTINFNPILAGTSAMTFGNVNQYFVGYGPFGVNGAAVNGSVTVTGSASPSVPDASSSLVMISGALLGLFALRRKFAQA